MNINFFQTTDVTVHENPDSVLSGDMDIVFRHGRGNVMGRIVLHENGSPIESGRLPVGVARAESEEPRGGPNITIDDVDRVEFERGGRKESEWIVLHVIRSEADDKKISLHL